MRENEGKISEDYDKRVLEINRRAQEMIIAHAEQLSSKSTRQENIQEIFKYMAETFPETKAELAEALGVLENVEFEDKNKFNNRAAEIMVHLLAKYFTLDELENKLRWLHKKMGYEVLSRGLTYDLEGTAVHLHVPVTFFESSKIALESLKTGLQVLAQKLKTDPQLQNVEKVVGHSNLVKDKPKIIAGLGFSITEQENSMPSDEAVMSKEKLLELYGQ